MASRIASAPTSCSRPRSTSRAPPRPRDPPERVEAGLIGGTSLARLRERTSAKWSVYEPDVLPAWVAEMDFPLAAPVKEALAAAIGRDDTGYANPAASGLA